AEGKWARRVELAPGQHAGLATTTQFIGYAADARSRVSLINDKMWCVPSDSAGSTAAAVLAIPSRDLQIRPGVSDTVAPDWAYLPRREICTNCHARLDFGVRFFNGYPDGRGASIYFVPELQLTGVGELYHHDIKDPRGKAALNPHSFAELAVKQPEFASCMVS